MKQSVKRNVVVFEAPLELTKQARELADAKLTSTSTICRQALKQYLSNYDMYYNTDKAV